LPEFEVETRRREEMIDITEQVRACVHDAGLEDGLCLVYTPHTTCGVTVNEGYDPDVAADVLRHLGKLVPEAGDWRHAEGNSDSHLKAILVGGDVTLPVRHRAPGLGRWQAVFLCEFDGPRRRRVEVVVR
jgi:secondary thiamine-phosphate synthase enzyme